LVDPFLGKNAYELLEQRGILARVRVRRVNTKVLTEASQVDAIDDFGDAFTHHQLDQLGRNKERNSILVSKILQFAKEHTVLVFACNVTHARRIAAALRVQRVSAAAVVEDTSAGVRAERLRQLQKGELRVLVSVDLITAGFDAPGVGAIVMGRPTTSLVRYMQMVGRGLRGRAAGGTDTCYVIDLRDRQGPKKQKAIHYGVIKQLWKQSSQSEKPGVASTDVG
jgi:superfamily II DNA or RNA helicase